MSELDLLLDRTENPIQVPSTVMTWLNVPVDRAALGRYVGQIPDRMLGLVRRLRSGISDEEVLRRVGPKLFSSEDPRYRFQEQEMEFWRPASTRINLKMAGLGCEEATASSSVGIVRLRVRLH